MTEHNNAEENFVSICSQFNESNRFGMVVLALHGNEQALHALPYALPLFKESDIETLAEMCFAGLMEPDYEPALSTIVSINKNRVLSKDFEQRIYTLARNALDEYENRFKLVSWNKDSEGNVLANTENFDESRARMILRASILEAEIGKRDNGMKHSWEENNKSIYTSEFTREAALLSFNGFSLNERFVGYQTMGRIGPGGWAGGAYGMLDRNPKGLAQAIEQTIEKGTPEAQVKAVDALWYDNHSRFKRFVTKVVQEGAPEAVDRLKEKIRHDCMDYAYLCIPRLSVALEHEELKDTVIEALKDKNRDPFRGYPYDQKAGLVFLQRLENLGEQKLIKRIAKEIQGPRGGSERFSYPFSRCKQDNPVIMILNQYFEKPESKSTTHDLGGGP